MSYYPTHDESDVLGATVGPTGPTGTDDGADGPTGSVGATGPTGTTGETGTSMDAFQTQDFGLSGNSARSDDTAVNITQRQRSLGERATFGTERMSYASTTDGWTCSETGIYRVTFQIAINRVSDTNERFALCRVTWGRYNTTSPRDDVLLEAYGGVGEPATGTGGSIISGMWVGTLTSGEKYGLWQDTAGNGTVRRPTGDSSTCLIEWVSEFNDG